VKTSCIALFLLISARTFAAPPPEKTPVDKAQKRRAFAKLREILKNEPTAKEVQAATLRFYKLEPERLESMASAARLKGLIPEFEAGMDNSVGHSYTNTRDGLYPTLSNLDPIGNPEGYKERVAGSSDQFLWRLRAVWSLDRLVFNAESLDVKSLGSLQENLVREVTTMYFARRRVISSLVLSPPDDEEELFYEQQRLEELTATLDALTGGMFAQRAWHPDSDR
jgi:hypothetical protein